MNGFYSVMRRIPWRRSRQERWLGGVLGSIAVATKIDVAWVRIAFLVFCLLPGPAFLCYAICWLIVPDQNNSIVLERLLGGLRTK
ncbi:PspC domain-containing protein [Psychromicrobium lacuslunae]|uniref:Phage-shock protein n=1 Tax=Psychromicrobium lacuslunae TaxID=1618207 RepID=A0A0D4BZM3_9MICC|nr:PspC domain-containing protein [Psychromicrobium lacuslunae]AJT41764.1 phage-shock protein [Psychromicrobium lacuslunae]